jgi:hypothetical protein
MCKLGESKPTNFTSPAGIWGGMSEHKCATRTVGAFQSNCFPHFKIEGFQLGSNFQPMFALLKT